MIRIHLISIYTKSSEFVSYLVHLFRKWFCCYLSDSPIHFRKSALLNSKTNSVILLRRSVVFGANVAFKVLKRYIKPIHVGTYRHLLRYCNFIRSGLVIHHVICNNKRTNIRHFLPL